MVRGGGGVVRGGGGVWLLYLREVYSCVCADL